MTNRLTLLSRPNLTPLGVVSGPFRPGLHTRSTRQGNYLKIRLGWYFFLSNNMKFGM